MLHQRSMAFASLLPGGGTHGAMSESLLDSAITVSRNALLDMGDSRQRSDLSTRLDLLERASWAIGLAPASYDQIVKLAKVIMDLRDEIVAARRDALGLPRFSLMQEPARRYLAG
jgi:hypothetical protein